MGKNQLIFFLGGNIMRSLLKTENLNQDIEIRSCKGCNHEGCKSCTTLVEIRILHVNGYKSKNSREQTMGKEPYWIEEKKRQDQNDLNPRDPN